VSRIAASGWAVALAVFLVLPPASHAAESEAEAFAELAMLEDTRCPDGKLVLTFLQSQSPGVRERAARTLARLQDSTTVTGLTGVLAGDVSVEARREAAFALGQVGHKSAGTALARAAQGDPDFAVRRLAIEAIGKLGDAAGTAPCVMAMSAPEATLRREGALALWRIADERALRPLSDALRDPDAEVRAAVAYALEKQADTLAVIRVTQEARGDTSALVRAYVARTLGRMRLPSATGALIELLEDESVAVRVNAARALGQIGDSAAVPQLLGRLADPHAYVREVALLALGQVGDASVAPTLQAMVRDAEAGVRAAVAVALGRLDTGREGFAAVEPLLADREEYVRASACEALAGFGDEPSEAALMAVLEGRNRRGEAAGARERAAAAAALGERQAAKAHAALVTALEEKEPAVVGSAAGALAAIGASDVATVRALIAAVRANASPNEPDIAVSGMEALTTLKAEAALPLGAEFLRSTQPQVREAAVALVRALGSEAEAARLLAENAPPAWQPAALAPYREAPPAARRAVLETDRGRIVLELFPDDAPRTVGNFVTLARKGYFDDTIYHRVVPNFVVQDGDPSRTGWGGPGYAIRCEYNRHRYDAGTVGMALAGKDTGGSQYFITHSPQPHLDGRYTIFGHVREGMDVMWQMQVGDRITRITVDG